MVGWGRLISLVAEKEMKERYAAVHGPRQRECDAPNSGGVSAHTIQAASPSIPTHLNAA